jgi:tetratricopeptide (TPR) repeat protein
MTLGTLGAGMYFEGRWSEAADLYRRTQRMSERIGDPVHLATAKMNEAELLVDQGRVEEGEVLLKEAMRVWRTTGDDWTMGFCLIQLGRIAAVRGRIEEAIGLLEQARDLYRSAGAPRQVLEVDACEAECRLRAGEASTALRMVADIGVKLEAEEEGVNALTPLLERIWGHALLALGDPERAEAAFDRGVKAARERGAEHEVGLSLQGLACLASRRGSRDLEIEREAAAIFERLGILAVAAYPRRGV